ncbi:hypothetical protein An16g02630 [Aspergillus niger]|uniref:Uncharacterized protein n=2 Tax=Aspergillus niger TaxID=5061 RepID=A2R784_ASPNC|nr:hypothetical protein An16g02630 [Aspergillus niger]CAK46793.1 hypothetical protein An16g02630 [Aspergillus niger]
MAMFCYAPDQVGIYSRSRPTFLWALIALLPACKNADVRREVEATGMMGNLIHWQEPSPKAC